MGFNTTVILMNDALEDIKNDPEFGKRLHDAVLRVGCEGYQDVSAHNSNGGIHCNAATVIETHHADGQSVVAVGHNTASVLGMVFYVGNLETDEGKLKAVKQLAENMGYTLRKKGK